VSKTVQKNKYNYQKLGSAEGEGAGTRPLNTPLDIMPVTIPRSFVFSAIRGVLVQGRLTDC